MANPNNPLAPGLNGAAPKGPHTIWNNPVFSAVLAIIMGFAMWIIVTVYIDPQGSTTVTGVPINYTSGASTYTAQGLDIVEKPDIEGVTVKLRATARSSATFAALTSWSTQATPVSAARARSRCACRPV